MTVCLPEWFLAGLLVAAVGRDVMKNGGLRSLVGQRPPDDKK